MLKIRWGGRGPEAIQPALEKGNREERFRFTLALGRAGHGRIMPKKYLCGIIGFDMPTTVEKEVLVKQPKGNPNNLVILDEKFFLRKADYCGRIGKVLCFNWFNV